MGDSFQNEVPTARVNIKLDLHTGGVQKKVELPLKLLTVGDFSNGREQRPLSEREKVDINKNNFNDVLAKFSPAVNLSVKNTLAGDDRKDDINLTFKNIRDFEPEQVARNIPQLRVLLAMRNLLRDLKSNLLDIAIPLLRDEAAQHLTQELTALTRLAPDSPQFAARAKIAYNQLKMYLMLSRPEQMEASFFSQTLMQDWPERAGISRASWQGVGPGLWQFWGEHLQAHPEWKIAADKNLISQVRTLLIRQMGIRNGEAALYQKIIEQVTPHYTDLRLEDMTGDTRAEHVFYTRNSVAGVYTRKAWEEEVLPAIEKIVNNRREEMDQVLGDDTHSASDPLSPQALKTRLSERYFTDFADNWLDFLNSIRWKRTQTLSDAIDQLTLIADNRPAKYA